ncbi:hypothetical protein SDC9_177427 [bioreactor metagenome]|uniref:Uncharacterized protein n=1 Tax=bioreactor metagenome TaxID=1076179 RepID=A0A645GUG2_9ZZZZ
MCLAIQHGSADPPQRLMRSGCLVKPRTDRQEVHKTADDLLDFATVPPRHNGAQNEVLLPGPMAQRYRQPSHEHDVGRHPLALT